MIQRKRLAFSNSAYTIDTCISTLFYLVIDITIFYGSRSSQKQQSDRLFN